MDPEEAALRSQQGRRFREERARDADARLGIAWWNDLTERERAEWMDRAGSAVPADAWEKFKRSTPQPERYGAGGGTPTNAPAIGGNGKPADQPGDDSRG